MEHEGDNYTNRDWCFWYSYQRIIKGTERRGRWRPSGNHPNDSIIENGQKTEKSPRDLRRFALTQTTVKKKSANADVKNSKGINKNNTKSIRLKTARWARLSTWNCARKLRLTIQTNGICTTQNLSGRMRHKLQWDFMIQKDHLISARRPELVIIH